MKMAAFLLALAALASCVATHPVSVEESLVVPAAQRLADYDQAATPNAGKVKITIIRDSGIKGSAIAARLIVDDSPVADIGTGQRVDLFLSPGSHEIGLYGTSLGLTSRVIDVRHPAIYRITPIVDTGFVLQSGK